MLTQVRLKELLDYDPDTGLFRWKLYRGRLAKRGDVAGGEGAKGYWRVWVDGKFYSAHRLAFLWMTGEWPEHEVDHINGVRADNRWANLRQSTRSENMHNRLTSIGKKNGTLLGVSKNTHGGKFSAVIAVDGKRHRIGSFPTPEAAHAAYLKAKDELHPTHQRLRKGT